MALVTVFMQGLQMFSEVGIGPSIIQNSKGDDREFLDTAWTIQILRGFALWIFSCLLAWPASVFFGTNDPSGADLLYILPVIGFSSVLGGFNSTAVFSLAGTALAIVGYKIFDLCTPGDLHEEIIKNRNVAAAVLGASIILGVCIVVAAAIMG